MNINFFETATLSDEKRAAIMRRSEADISEIIEQVVPIIDKVDKEGDAAIVEFGQKFDRAAVTIDNIKATPEDFEQAHKTLDPEIKKAILTARDNIQQYHEEQMPEEMWLKEMQEGVLAGEKISPIHSIGLYVPRGKGSFPSVMLMLGVPAVIAKVPQIVVCTPPREDGSIDDATLVAAEACGIKDVYRVGGAQAIAALAYGTETVPKVSKTLGPGNAYVSAAKRVLYGKIDVGVPAGPSESIILCDDSVSPRTAAVDLLIEAEHGPDSTALLVTHSRKMAEGVLKVLPELIKELPENRQEYCQTVLTNYGGIVLTSSLEESFDFVNDFAPEHLEVIVEDPMMALPKIVHAGEILMGPHAPITLGNFSLGVNAILPTGGFAKSCSCVTVFDYLKRTSIAYVNRKGFEKLSESALPLADYEGFPSHARAIRERLK